jgi:superfamily II DNA helicase RecQ
MTDNVRNQINRVLFVYARDGIIKCLNYDEATQIAEQLKREGWEHTATIDSARWIEAIVNPREFEDDDHPKWLFDEMRFGWKERAK